jgi:hypothetical protein
VSATGETAASPDPNVVDVEVRIMHECVHDCELSCIQLIVFTPASQGSPRPRPSIERRGEIEAPGEHVPDQRRHIDSTAGSQDTCPLSLADQFRQTEGQSSCAIPSTRTDLTG